MKLISLWPKRPLESALAHWIGPAGWAGRPKFRRGVSSCSVATPALAPLGLKPEDGLEAANLEQVAAAGGAGTPYRGAAGPNRGRLHVQRPALGRAHPGIPGP